MLTRLLLGSLLGVTLAAVSPAARVNAQTAPIFGGRSLAGAEARFVTILEHDIRSGDSVAQIGADPRLAHIFQLVDARGAGAEQRFLRNVGADLRLVSWFDSLFGLRAQAAENLLLLSNLQGDLSACRQGHCPVSPF